MSRPVSDQPRPAVLGVPLGWMFAALAVALALICATASALLLDARDDARARASTAIANLSAAVTRDIARNVELYDLSIQGVLEGLAKPEVMAAPKPLRQLILFDRAASDPFLGSILVLDEHGDVAIDSRSVEPRSTDYADRDYFKAHAERADLGLYISRPIVARTDHQLVLGLSRRITRPDGSFGGVVVGTLRLDYLRQLCGHMKLGPGGSLTLFRTDGTILMREPFDPQVVGRVYGPTLLFDHLKQAPEGEYMAQSVVDRVLRLYHYQRVGDLPLVQNVAMSVADVDADWRGKAVWTAAALGACCAIILLLAVALRRELRRRAEAEATLVALSEEDRLTGLANRRRFDAALASEWRRAARLGGPVALLMVDADLFKSFNDSLGHLAGDAVLAALGRCLAGRARRPGDVAARYGGEEFAVVLPDMAGPDAMRIAETIRREVLDLKIDHPGSTWRKVSVSIGVASLRPSPDQSPADLIAAADAALYASKAAGRNRSTLHLPRPEPVNGRDALTAVEWPAQGAGASTVGPNTSAKDARRAASTCAIVARRPRSSRLVTPRCASAMPQGTIPPKWDRSGATLTDTPWKLTQRRSRTPIAATLSSATAPPGPGGLSGRATHTPTRPARGPAATPSRASAPATQASSAATKACTSGRRLRRSSMT